MCPLLKKEQNFTGQDRDALLVVVGNHFTLCVDRDYSRVIAHMQQHLSGKNSRSHTCKGSGPLFVDYLLESPDLLTTCTPEGEEFTNRDLAVDYLELEGSYGLVYEPEMSENKAANSARIRSSHQSTTSPSPPSWSILQSTLPWREGRSAIRPGDLSIQFNSLNGNVSDCSVMSKVTWNSRTEKRGGEDEKRGNNNHNYCAGGWDVLECSFSRSELQSMFFLNSFGGSAHPRSRL
jgi:hypothetical protein